MAMVPLTAQSAGAFANPAFQQQWSGVETTIPNFWGPLDTARDGQIEPYAEGAVNGQPGQRLVQYFDKARMELRGDNTVTNGLLTVELKSGQLQLGDNAFTALAPAQIGVAGDEGSPGPTYATLGLLMEREPQANGSVALNYDVNTGNFTRGAASGDANAVFTTYLGDPNGRFGQNVPRAFADFLQRIPGGYLSAMGYPITPAFGATVTLRGQAGVPVIVQAFQRKVLTYTPSNQTAFQVEFGNIGRHYYTWRYMMGSIPASATAMATATGTATATATANPATQTVVAAATQTVIAATVGSGASAVQTAVAETAAAGAASQTAAAGTAAAMSGAVQTAVAQTAAAAAATSAAGTAAAGMGPAQTAAAQTAAAGAVSQTAAAQTAAAGGASAVQTAAAAATQTAVSSRATQTAVAVGTPIPVAPMRPSG